MEKKELVGQYVINHADDRIYLVSDFVEDGLIADDYYILSDDKGRTVIADCDDVELY